MLPFVTLRRSALAGACMCLLELISRNAYAVEQYRVIESARFLGRGNASVAAYDSNDAYMINPATLAEPAKLRWQLRPLELGFFVGQNSIDAIGDLASADFNNDGLTAVLKTFGEQFGKRQYFRGQMIPLAMRILSFEITPFIANSNFIDMRIPAIPQVEIRSDSYAGVNLAYGHAISKQLSLGMNVRPYFRYFIGGELAFSDVMDFLPPSTKEIADVLPQKSGQAVAVDLGLIWARSDTSRYGFKIEDIGYTSVMASEDGKAPPPVPMRVSMGGNWRYKLGKRWNWDLAADVVDVLNSQNVDFFRLLHLGTEFGTSYFSRDNDFGFLAGVNEGYFTGGVYADLWLARLEIVNYAVELGEYTGQRMDRRWAATIKTSMTF